MAITKELIDGLIVTIQNLYLADDIPWMVGYSGGKDSTAAVQLVWMALEKLSKKDRKKLRISRSRANKYTSFSLLIMKKLLLMHKYTIYFLT